MSTTLPRTMRALVQTNPASTNIELVERPVPTPRHEKGEYLLYVHAASPCAGELLWPRFGDIPGKDVIITCDDVAGVLVSAPTGSEFKVGEYVYARTSYNRPGCACDYAIATTEELAHRPAVLTSTESAAVPLSAETAWQALFEHAGVGHFGSENWKDKRVLITAASGGVGSWVTQFAALAGAEVVGVCGPKNLAFVRSLGAKEVVNYHTDDLSEYAETAAKRFDVVIDCIGGVSLEKAWWCVRDNGAVVSIYEPPKDKRPPGLEVAGFKDTFFIMKPSGHDLQQITRLIDDGKCRPFVDSVWPLEQFQHAYQRVDGGHARGKVVFDLRMNTPKHTEKGSRVITL